MMSLCAQDATFTNRSTATTDVGADQLGSFWAGSSSLVNDRFSLVPVLQDHERGG